MSYKVATFSSILVGWKIKSLTILANLGKRMYAKRSRVFVLVICDCGTQKEVCWEAIRDGRTISCGCQNRKMARERMTTHGYSRCGGDKERMHNIWGDMIQRCSNPNIGDNYKYYGGKGIKVCGRWRVFSNFLSDMGEPPTNKHTIDRYPDKNGDYEPGNCRWALMEVQNRNTSRNKYVIFGNEKLTWSEAARKLNIPRTTFRTRMLNGSLKLEIVK